LILAGLALGLVGAEFAARLRGLQPGQHVLRGAAGDQGWAEPHRLLQYVPRPGICYRKGVLGQRTEVCFDEHSLREDDPITGPSWLVLGDSFTHAEAVHRHDSFPALLTEQTGTRFLNGGLSGWGTWEELHRYRELRDELPLEGVVVVFFVGNDLLDNGDFRPLDELPPQDADAGPMGREFTGGGWNPGDALMSVSVLANIIAVERERRVHSPHLEEAWRRELTIFTPGGSERLAQLLGETREALSALQRETSQAGHPLLVAVAPEPAEVALEWAAPSFDKAGLDPTESALDVPRRSVLTLLDELRIDRCDLEPALRQAQDAGTEPFLRWDGHWSPAGHEVVADAITACLERSGAP